MSDVELKKQLLEKIKKTNDRNLLEETSRLLGIHLESEPYRLSADHSMAVNEAREQIRKGESLTGPDADKEIDEWLGK